MPTMTQPERAPRYLTKSRFKLALECPTKLDYTGDPFWTNTSVDNSFLSALAEGGFQVGALACAMFPGGVEVTDTGHAAQLARTRELLQREDVTIYEAALEAEGLFVRVDILRKCGRAIELIEVKAKSYDPRDDADFRNARGELQPAFLPYLRDIAFQRHVAAKACPGFEFNCFLMLADKSLVASVDRLNQRFPIVRADGRVRVQAPVHLDAASLGAPILTAVDVDAQVHEILNGPLAIADEETLSFDDAVRRLADAYAASERIDTRPGMKCASCEFKSTTSADQAAGRSGFHRCWTAAFGLTIDEFRAGTVLDLWNFAGKRKLIERGVVRLAQVTREDIGFDGRPPGPRGMSRSHRQWYQLHTDWPGGGPFHLATAELHAERAAWRYPLHFIDFETAAVPIPFVAGRAPYQTTAFQFSHHVMQADGSIEHRTQWLQAQPGTHPNIAFVRALHAALGGDDGTVFRWATHENTVLNQLHAELTLQTNPPADAAELVAFIDTLTTRDEGGHRGHRAMTDLCKLAERFFLHPATQGSSSLKKVLPALMASSAYLRETYSQPVYGTPAMRSLNFMQPIAWWQELDGQVLDPYRLLPPVVAESTFEEQQALVSSTASHLKDGGAAMAAYAQLQSTTLSVAQRSDTESALLRYCELDTLAMVMTVQAWNAWLAERGYRS